MDVPQAISPDQLMQRDAPFYSSHPDPAAGQIWARKQRTTWQTIDRFNCISSSIGFGTEVLLSFLLPTAGCWLVKGNLKYYTEIKFNCPRFIASSERTWYIECFVVIKGNLSRGERREDSFTFL